MNTFATLPPQDFPPYMKWKAPEIEKVVSIIIQETPRDRAIENSRALERYAISSPRTRNKYRITEIAQLKDNWDGYGALSTYKDVVNNSYRFLDALFSEYGIVNLDREDIYPTTYGSIVMEITSPVGMVSVEIGKHQIGFFTDFEEDCNFLSEGETTDFHSIPKQLHKALDTLYGPQKYNILYEGKEQQCNR